MRVDLDAANGSRLAIATRDFGGRERVLSAIAGLGVARGGDHADQCNGKCGIVHARSVINDHEQVLFERANAAAPGAARLAG